MEKDSVGVEAQSEIHPLKLDYPSYLPKELWMMIFSLLTITIPRSDTHLLRAVKNKTQSAFLGLRGVCKEWSTTIPSCITAVYLTENVPTRTLAQYLQRLPNLTEVTVVFERHRDSYQVKMIETLAKLRLKRLDIFDLGLAQGNSSKTLIPVLTTLTDLTSLELPHGQELLAMIDNAEKFTQLQSLTCVASSDHTLPSKLTMLTALRQLIIPNHLYRSNTMSSLMALTQLEVLSYRPWRCDSLSSLPYLRDLRVAAVQSIEGMNGDMLQRLEVHRSISLAEDTHVLSQLTKLTTLVLSSCGLKCVPKEVLVLTRLTALNLEYNEIGSVPNEIEGLTNLRTLNMQQNEITKLPVKELEKLMECKLRLLRLTGNRITEEDKQALQQCKWAGEMYLQFYFER